MRRVVNAITSWVGLVVTIGTVAIGLVAGGVAAGLYIGGVISDFNSHQRQSWHRDAGVLIRELKETQALLILRVDHLEDLVMEVKAENDPGASGIPYRREWPGAGP